MIYYINSTGEKINFDGPEYEIADMDVFKHEFAYKQENYRVKEIKAKPQIYTIETNISKNASEDWCELYDKMLGVFNKDLATEKNGRMWINGSYIPCYIYASELEETWDDYGFNVATLKIVPDYPYWCKEKSYSFKLNEKQITDTVEKEEISDILDSTSQNPDYPWDYKRSFRSRYKPAKKRYLRDYSYDFCDNHTIRKIDNDHFAESAFKMIIYGPCTHPFIQIGDHIYEVDTTLYDSEYLVIDSRERTVIKYTRYGATENLFNARSKEYNVFEKIQSGKQKVKWSTTYAFDLILYQERSEPLWK